MSRIDALNARYKASASLIRHGVELLVIGDPVGSRLNAAVRQLLLAVNDDGPEIWGELVGAAKALRWRLVTQPQPLDFNPALLASVAGVAREVDHLRGAVAVNGNRLLDEVAEAAEMVTGSDPVAGAVLLRSVLEVGADDCVVVAVDAASAAGLEAWLGEKGVSVRKPAALARQVPSCEQVYAVGPPPIFPSSLVTAPTCNALSFVLPAWYSDRSIPRSAIAAYADGAVKVGARIFTEGDLSALSVSAVEVDDQLLPQPVWGKQLPPDREPTRDEVLAHQVFLSGNLAIFLDDGERIRSLDPSQPGGERVTYTEVNAVRRGTYLLLRKGRTDRDVLYEAALCLMGVEASRTRASQLHWKGLLQQRLDQDGLTTVMAELRSLGIRTLDRVRAWVEPTLARPRSEHDFELLLQWLGLPIQPTFGYATNLRRLRAQASANVREELEKAISDADLSLLERHGHLELDVKTAGFRGIVASRVLAISPVAEIVSRHEARVPFEHRRAQWLE